MGSSGFLLPMEARGIYREMLTQAWRREARLPNDHEAIRRAIGATAQEWKRSWPAVQRYWRVDGDTLVNDTQLQVYAEAQGVAQRASERGLKGAQARAQARAQAKPEDKPPSPSPKDQNQDQNIPALPRRDEHANGTENRKANSRSQAGAVQAALRDRQGDHHSRADDRQLRVVGADQSADREAGLHLSGRGSGDDSSGDALGGGGHGESRSTPAVSRGTAPLPATETPPAAAHSQVGSIEPAGVRSGSGNDSAIPNIEAIVGAIRKAAL
jgi:uncharacterized protein YdaU (DUF1376 family)